MADIITAAQIRGARGLLDVPQGTLADWTGISATSIGSIENGQSLPRASTLEVIRKSFEDRGIEFIGMEGVRLKTGDVRVFKGQRGFHEFYDHVYDVIRDQGGEIMISNVVEKQFLKWAGEDFAESHMKRVSELDNVKFKILVQEGDTNFVASEYAEYRWLPKNQFSSVPFYTFGDKFSVMTLETDPVVLVLNYPSIAEAFRIQFRAMWDQAMVPEKY